MALTITLAQAVNTLLRWLADEAAPGRQVPTNEEARLAAETLADPAYRVLSAGLKASDMVGIMGSIHARLLRGSPAARQHWLAMQPLCHSCRDSGGAPGCSASMECAKGPGGILVITACGGYRSVAAEGVTDAD